MGKYWLLLFLLLGLMSQVCLTQTLPRSLKAYLDRNYRGWELAGECYEKPDENKRILVGDFDGNGKRDYAVKFVRGSKGFMMAFLSKGVGWKPFFLHIYDAEDAKFSDLLLFEKGEKYDASYPWKLKTDAPADFRCESDVGGIHVYRKGKFIGY